MKKAEKMVAPGRMRPQVRNHMCGSLYTKKHTLTLDFCTQKVMEGYEY
jgi:hypothetical protein